MFCLHNRLQSFQLHVYVYTGTPAVPQSKLLQHLLIVIIVPSEQVSRHFVTVEAQRSLHQAWHFQQSVKKRKEYETLTLNWPENVSTDGKASKHFILERRDRSSDRNVPSHLGCLQPALTEFRGVQYLKTDNLIELLKMVPKLPNVC